MKKIKVSDPYALEFCTGNPRLFTRNQELMQSRINKWEFIRKEEIKHELDQHFQEIEKAEAEKFVAEYPDVMVYGVTPSGKYTWLSAEQETECYKMFGIL